MNWKILHLLPAMGKIPEIKDRSGAAGISSGTLSLALIQNELYQQVKIISWCASASQSYRLKNLQVIYLSHWGRFKFRHWDFRWIFPVYVGALREAADILHVHSDPNLLLAAHAKVRLLHFRTPVPENLNRTYRWLVNQADGMICNSQFIANQVHHRLDFPEEKVFVVHNGADSDFFENLDRKIYRDPWGWKAGDVGVVFAGALVPDKGVDHAILAFQKAFRANPRLKLAVIGSPGLWPTIDNPSGENTAYADRLVSLSQGLPVHFAGSLSRQDMPKALAAADLVVVPSVWDEPFGTIVCEAMAAQKPVIAYRSGGIPEIIVDGETGYLVPKGDIDLLAGRIVQLAADPTLGAAMGLAARERAEKEFTWQKTAGRLDAIYAACLARTDRRR